LKDITKTDHEVTADWWRIDMKLDNEYSRIIRVSDTGVSFEIDDQTTKRLAKKHKKPVIFFEPNDLWMLYGSPARRREFIDRFIVQVDPQYGSILRRFDRVLAQRNRLLKDVATEDSLFVWNIQFAELSEKIISRRIEWVERINDRISRVYAVIANNNDKVSIRYNTHHQTSQEILNSLHGEFVRGDRFTKTGPHTHDISLLFNTRSAKQTASRGENRTLLFAILGVMAELINEQLNTEAYILLDDVDGELDATRKKRFYPQIKYIYSYRL
jgi:DNA replication and repair protein RecF